jgi:hypothetical protein
MLRKFYDWLHPKDYSTEVDESSSNKALEAIEKANQDLLEAYSRRPLIEALVSQAEMQLARNGFGAMITASMERK